MNSRVIQEISRKHLGKIPLAINRMTIGICNEVYELKYDSESFILRLNKEKEWIYGTHKFLPLFKKLKIKTPEIIAEDYAKTDFPFCYQIQTKLEGKDLGLVIDTLSPSELRQIAKEVSDIFDKFNSLPEPEGFGLWTGLREEKLDSLLAGIEKNRKAVVERNRTTQVIDEELLHLYDELIETYKHYFLQIKPKLYYDDICSKNVMIHDGKFNGLVDLDFLIKGDYLEAIGRMIASWHGEEAGENYIKEIIKLQKLDVFQQKIIKVYAIFNLIGWMSEEGIKFNDNSTGEVNWDNVKKKRKKIMKLFSKIA